jgi:NADPH:quinone reductase-like Zn-dependent oxidoreductase
MPRVIKNLNLPEVYHHQLSYIDINMIDAMQWRRSKRRASQVIDYRKAQFEKVLREKVDVVFDLVGGDTQQGSFLVLKEGGHLVSATQPVSQEEAARHHVSGAMIRLAPSGDVFGRIARLLEEETIRPDVASVYALQDAPQAWKDIAGNLPGVHGMSPSGLGEARRRSHGKIVLRVA